MADAEPSAALLALCRRLPKVELHAHLNGSLRESTLLELASARDIDPAVRQLVRKGARLVANSVSARCMLMHVDLQKQVYVVCSEEDWGKLRWCRLATLASLSARLLAG